MKRAWLVLPALALACTNIETSGTSSGGSAGDVVFSVSGEALAYVGYRFPAPAGDVAFVDGWEVAFDEVLVTVGDVTLSEDPDVAPTDPSRTGPVVGTLPGGPWALDLHQRGDLAGKGGGGETAVRLGTMSGKKLDLERRYAFGFRIPRATHDAHLVNLSPAAAADYDEMVAKGWSALFVGTATFKGTACTTSADGYAFDRLPKVVHFRFGFGTPARYVNCQNPDADPARPIEGEEHARGVQLRPNQPVVAQLTVHTDHVFWDALQHDAALHFDMVAARHLDEAAATATLDDFAGVPFAPFVDEDGKTLPWRSCVPAAAWSLPRGPLAFDAEGVGVRDWRDFASYAESTMGHLNADGLCFVEREYPSPR